MKTNLNPTKITLAILGLIALVVGLAIFVFIPKSLRLDEAQSLWQTGHTLGGMYQVLLNDVHVPLYHTVLHFWTLFLGNEVAVARTLSLVFFILALPAVYMLARQAISRNAALFATALFAVSPFMNWYGSEIRMYSLLVLMIVLSQYFYLRILKTNDSLDWILYTVVTVAGVYTHYFFIFNVLTQGVFYIIKRKDFPKNSFKKFLLAGAVVILSFAPWAISFVRAGSASRSQPLLPEPTTSEVLSSYFKYIFGFYSDNFNALVVSLWPILIVLIFLVVLRKTFETSIEIQYLFLSTFVPVFAVFIISVTLTPLYLPRYLIIILPALCISVAWYLSNYPPQVSKVFGLLLLSGVFFSLIYQITVTGISVDEDYRAVVDYLEENSDIQDVILVSAPFTIYPIEYYYRESTALITLPVWERNEAGGIPAFNTDTFPEELKSVTDGHRTAWLILSYDQGYEKDIKDYFGNNFELLEKKEFSKGLTLYRYQLYNFVGEN